MRALRLLLALLLPPALGLWLLSTPAAPPQAFTPVDYDCDAADVVILGNSKVESDIDAEALGGALGRRVVLAFQYGSNAPVWYAMLDNEVFARCHPATVVLYGPLEQVLGADVEASERVRLLAPHLDGADPVLDEKVFGRDVGPRARALALREAALSAVAAGAAGGRKRLDSAFDKVFGQGWQPVAPTATPAAPTPGHAVDAADLMATRWEESFLPDFLALAESRGTRVLFVASPLPPSRQRFDLDTRPGVETIVARAQAANAWVDARKLGPDDAGFTDFRHMNGAGKAAFTEALAGALREAGVGGAGRAVAPFVSLLAPLSFAAPPPAPALGAPSEAGAQRRIPLGELASLTREACEVRAQLRCASPLRVRLAGELVAADLRAGELHAPAGGEPALDPARDGNGSRWLYPGDEATASLTLAEAHPAAVLALTGTRVTGTADLRVAWSSSGGTRGSTTVDARRLSLSTTVPVGPLAAGERLDVTLGAGDGYTLLTSFGVR